MRPRLEEGINDSNDVRLVQQLLRDLQYYEGDIDGDFGPVTKQAVERYQDDAGITDERGVVDTQTWGSLESHFGQLDGLRAEESVNEFVEDTYGVANSSMDPADRLEAMQGAANEQLANAGVPWVAFQFQALGGGTIGQFDFTTWVVQIDPTAFNTAFESMRGVEALNTIYHEARHAEQWWLIARLMAGLFEMDAAAITAQTHIPETVTGAAAADPILQSDATTDRAIAWYESVYGAGWRERNRILGGGTQQEYRDLPEESDSWDTGASVEREYDEYERGGGGGTRPTLEVGDNNPSEIRYLQELLRYRGISVEDPDGDFGTLTKAAVETFQASRGLSPVDGIVGPATWEALIP